MRISRRLAVVGVAVVIGAIWLVGDSGVLTPERHLDGQGPLASLNTSDSRISQTVDRTESSVWTFGYPLCLAQGDEPAIIDSIGPTHAVGTGFRYLGSLMRTFDVEPGIDSVHEPIGSVDGFPPPVKYAPDYLRPAIGYPVSVLCPKGDPSPPVTYTELLVGFAAVGSDGGGWLGIDIGYTVGGRHRIVSLNYDQLVCGRATEVACTDGTPSPGPPATRTIDGDDAADLTALTFERAFVAIGTYRFGQAGLRAWLMRIARNAAIDHGRRRRAAPLVEVEPSSFAGPEAQLEADEAALELRRRVAALPADQRDAIVLRFAGGLSAREIGLVLAKSEAASQKLVSRGLDALKEVYGVRPTKR